ncbi:MAG: phosphatidate cytidylyltransferase, partial [Firmicutes bacterium]|nr:phosphatidate cytidylyltransferase [Bacillota bacterium]
MLGLRVLTAIIGIPLVIIAVGLGGSVLFVGVAVLAAVAVYEFYRMFALREMCFFPFTGIVWIVLLLW